jgi:hypothetical protein
MRRHVVRAFVVVLVAGIFGYQLIKNLSTSRRAAGAAFSIIVKAGMRGR